MTSSDLENRSRSTKFNRLLSLPKGNLDVKYEHPATKTLDCRVVTRVIRTDGQTDGPRERRTEGQTARVMTIPFGPDGLWAKRGSILKIIMIICNIPIIHLLKCIMFDWSQPF